MYGLSSLSQESLAALKDALEQNDPSLLAKAFVAPTTATTGLQIYSLEAPSKKLFPVLTPLRNFIPRNGGGRAIQANWKAITAINSTNVPATVSEGNRAGVISTTITEYLAAFRGIGLEDSVTFEAEYAGDGFEDVRAMATGNVLKATMIAEEALILGGQGTWSLGTTGTPTGALQTDSVSAMTARAVVAYCVALTYDGWKRATVSATGVIDQVAVTRAGPYGGTDTVNGGHAIMSAESGAVTTDATHKSIIWTVAAVPGAYAYAWYTGVTGAANCKLAAITTVNKFTQTANEGGANQASNFTGFGSDRSANALAFDGLTTIAAKSGSGAFYRSLDGAALTFDNAGACVEFDAALSNWYDGGNGIQAGGLKFSPSDVWISSLDISKFSKGILTGASAPIWRINTVEGNATVQGGGMAATSYLNKVTGSALNVHVHPNMPSGKFLFTTSELPFPLNGIPQLYRILTRAEYRSYEWPLVTRKYEFGVYADEVLQIYFPPSLGVLDNATLT